MKKWLAILCAAAMITTSFAGCGSPSTDGNASTPQDPAAKNEDTTTTTASGAEVLMGVLAPLTGEVSVYGITTKNGIELGAEKINSNGGIDGKNIKLEILDEKGDVAEAVNAYNLLKSKEISALIGDVTSKPTVAVAEIAAQEYADGEGIPMITATGTTPDITTYGENVFRTCFIDPFQGKVMATFAAENLQAKNVAIMYNTSDDYSKGIADAFEASAKEKGMTVVAKEGYGNDDKDFNTQLTKIQAAKPDAIMIPDYYNRVALIAQQARTAGYTGPMLGGDGWDGVLGVLDEGNKDVVNNCYFPNHFFVNDTDPIVADFVKSYTEKYGQTPTAFSALGYDSLNIMAEAIKKAGSTDSQAVVAALKGLEYDGVTGHITFDENGDPIKSVAVLEIKDGVISLNSKIEP